MRKAKVLIVEDEPIIALDLKRTIEKLDFEVTSTATSYNTALNSVRVNEPDIILMDINLGEEGKDGIETTKKIQKMSKIPVIYITGSTDLETLNRAIETNPVSYITKPFKREDLKSNILLGLYKSNKNPNFENKELHDLGLGYFFDIKTNKLFYQDFPIKLSKKETLLLKILIEAKGELVSFEDLEYQLWPTRTVSASTLRTLIYRLRTKLEHKLIDTVQMAGCRLVKKED